MRDKVMLWLVCLLAQPTIHMLATEQGGKPRVLVFSDISNEPDDEESCHPGSWCIGSLLS